MITAACRDLRQLAERMPPGPERSQLLLDITVLKVRLMALPARVAIQAEMKPAAEVKAVLDREIDDAFRHVRKWMQ